MSAITTHVLDTSLGKPGAGISVRLEMSDDVGSWETLAEGTTDSDGRVGDLLKADHDLQKGTYRITFNTADYFLNLKKETFYPYATIVFSVVNNKEHYHVPLLLSGHGYSTYRGS